MLKDYRRLFFYFYQIKLERLGLMGDRNLNFNELDKSHKQSISSITGKLFNFRKLIEINGGTLGIFKINEKRHGVYKIKA